MRWLAPAVVACLAAAAAGQRPESPPSLVPSTTPKRFVFDGRFQASRGVKFVMARGVPTVDPTGAQIAPNAPRFAQESALAGAPAFQQVRESESLVSVLASGLDHDGETPLLVTYEANATTPVIDVFSVEGDALLNAEQTGQGRTRTLLGPAADLMLGTMPGKQYQVTSGVVCHGLIVIFCTVREWDASLQRYQDAANAFVVSQDRGATWKVAYESPPFVPGPTRGAPWTMQNWWPMKRHAAPAEAYFAATDYCANPGAPGGRLYLLRATRSGIGEPWTVGPGAIALEVSGNSSEHLHVGGVLPFGDRGIRAFAAIGDGRTNNRIVSLVNRDGDHTSGAWEVDHTYHGARGIPGVEGNQFVGCAPGPFADSVLAGSDLTVEQVSLLTMSTDTLHPVTQRLVGLTAMDGLNNNAFIIRTPTPERGGPYCANTEPYFQLPVPYVKRMLYSPDGLHWAQAAAPARGYPTIHGGHIYFDGAQGQGLMRTPVPAFVAGRPLLVGPGGFQHSRADAVMNPPANGRVTLLQRDATGRWLDDGVPLQPQPPSLGPVYRVRTTSADTSPVIGRIFPAGMTNPLNRVLGTHLQVRVWAMHMDPSRSATLQVGIGDSVAAPQMYRGVNFHSMGSWVPMVVSEPVEIPAGRALQLYLRCVGEVCNDQTMYVALDAVGEGAGMPGYPAPPDASIPAVGTPNPDEVARITGIACAKTWTITLAVQIPEDGFDFRSRNQDMWPLATLWGDDANYIELAANTRTGSVSARVTCNGRPVRVLASDPIPLLRGAPILVSIAQPTGSSGTEMTISAAGQPVHTRATPFPAAPSLRTQPREIRFSAATAPPSSSGRGTAVSPLLIWGGRVDEHAALSRAERERLLRDLSFITSSIP